MHKPATGMRTAGILAFLALVLAPGQGTRAELPGCPVGTERHAEYRLFFGRNRGNEEVVSDTDWREFLAGEITPRFPDGLTVLDAAGQWRGSSGEIERERSKVLLLLTSPGAEGIRLTDEIAEAYKRHFGQESVLRTVGSACASF